MLLTHIVHVNRFKHILKIIWVHLMKFTRPGNRDDDNITITYMIKYILSLLLYHGKLLQLIVMLSLANSIFI